MSGWKTWAGAALVGLSAGLKAAGMDEWASLASTLGAALGMVGLGHKLEKRG